MKRTIRSLLSAAAVLLATAGVTAAQAYPTKPVRVVVAWPPGSIIDVLMRIMVEPLSTELGQPVIVDNKAGATGVIGADLVAQSAPDGYTFLYTSAALNMIRAMGQKTPYEMPDSFTPVVNTAWSPMVLVAHPSLNLKTPQDLVALARQKPGQLFYATSGNGAPSHFTAELFRSRTGIQATSVAYRGSPQAMTDQIAGQVQFHFAVSSTALPQVRDGKVTALGVTSKKRLDVAPEIPTMEEQGFTNFQASYWNGLLGPKGLPMPIANRIAEAVNKVLANPDVLRRAAPSANEIDGKSNPQSFAAMIAEDYKVWAEVARVANIKPE
jgi:tripartite-type tricarboxylate transporter receptor subunit TctC